MTIDSDEIIDCMARMKGDKQPFALATVVRTADATSAKAGAKAVIRADGSMVGWVGGGCTQSAVKTAAAQALLDGRARMIRVRPAGAGESGAGESGAGESGAGESGAGESSEAADDYKNRCPSGGTTELFIEPILPRPFLLVAGASQTARALCELGKRVGFAVTVAALPEDLKHFPQADGRIEGFDLAGESRASTSFVVVATQGKRDREALEAALACGAGFVAFVASRRKAAKLKAQLLARGADRERVAALRSPAGLDIGAVTPDEIALSVLAEIVQERRKGGSVRPVENEVVEDEVIEGATVETRLIQPDAGGCCGDGGKH